MQALLFFSHVAIVALLLSSLLLSLPFFVVATGLRYLYLVLKLDCQLLANYMCVHEDPLLTSI